MEFFSFVQPLAVFLIALTAAGTGFGWILTRTTKPLEKDVNRLEADIKSLKGDIKGLKGDIKSLEGDIKSLETGQTEMKADIKLLLARSIK